MKRIFILVLFVIFCQVSFGQVYQLMPQYGYQAMRMNFDSTLQIPTVCGVPTLKSVHNTKRGAIAFDSCNNRFYTYNPKTLTWSYLGSGGGSQNLQQVTDVGNTTTNNIKLNKLYFYDSLNFWHSMNLKVEDETFYIHSDTLNTDIFRATDGFIQILNNSGTNVGTISTGNLVGVKTSELPNVNSTLVASINNNFADANGNISLNIIDSLKRSTDSVFAKRNGSWVFQYKDSIGGGNGFVPYTGATQDVDLGTNKLSAHSVYITGTNGNGHLHLKHQASDATATGQSTSLFADANGDIKWKNDGNYYTTLKTSGNTADRVYTYPNATTTLIGASDTASMLTNYAKTSAVNLKLNISDTSVFDRKSIAAFTFKANNTASTANATDQVFRDSGTLTYSGTITWTGTTAPSGATSHRYRWCQIGKQVTITFSINYATAGSALTAVKLTLPVGCPAPSNFGTLTGANDVLGSAWAFLGTATSTVTTGRVLLQNNATNNGYEFNIAAASANYKVAGFTLTYFTD